MTTTFIRKIMKGKKIMQKETKKERFDRISEARKIDVYKRQAESEPKIHAIL